MAERGRLNPRKLFLGSPLVIGFAHDFGPGCLAQIEHRAANLQIVGQQYNWVKTADEKFSAKPHSQGTPNSSIRRLRRTSEVLNQRVDAGLNEWLVYRTVAG